MMLPADDPLAILLVAAIQRGDVAMLTQHLVDQPALANARIVDRKGVARSLLHVVADWPGHVPNGAQLVASLAHAGADMNAHVTQAGPHPSAETALHWAASSNDVSVLDALLDHGADIEANGAIFTGGAAMSDAVIFAQWHAARRLHARGATTTLSQAAALGLLERVHALLATPNAPTPSQLTNALWHACRGGQRGVVELLHARGADVNWIGHDHKTALDVAMEGDAPALVGWLIGVGAQRASRV